MGYYDIGLKYPEVRAEEMELLNKYKITAATQTPSLDALVKIPRNPSIGLSFINLHHFTDDEKRKLIDRDNFDVHHIFEVPKYFSNASFLDEFITNNSSREHIGHYIDFQTFEDYEYLKIEYQKHNHIKWHLKEQIAEEYMRNVFGLHRNISLDLLDSLNYDGESFDWFIQYTKLIKI